jgi:putative membrane protein
LDILYRYIHFLGIVLLSGTLMGEVLLVRARLSGLELRRLAMLDGAFGMSFLVVLAGGLLQWFAGAKPSDFYTHNPMFMAKLGLVGAVALLSIHPTVWFIRHRKRPDADQVAVPGSVRFLVRLEMALLLAVPLLAVLMARGVGAR